MRKVRVTVHVTVEVPSCRDADEAIATMQEEGCAMVKVRRALDRGEALVDYGVSDAQVIE